jgi:uncharacterized protein
MTTLASPRRGVRWIAAALLLLLGLFTRSALAAFEPPPLSGHVVDTAGKLRRDEVLDLDAKLEAIRRETGFEIVALVPRSLEGETIEDVAYTAFNTWRLGRKDLDNGVLLVIAPEDRRVRIETGKGVGGALTDLQSNDILHDTVGPLLRQERFHDAIDQGTQAIARALVAGAPGAARPPEHAPGAGLVSIGIKVGLVLLVILLAIFSPGFRRLLFFMLLFGRGGRSGGGGGGGSGFTGGGGASGGGGSSGSY